MWLIILLSIIILSIVVFIFREHIAFKRGRLSRPYNRSSTTPITNMEPDQFIELSFGTVHYIYHPGRSSTLPLNIFVHGYSTPMDMWEYVFPTFVKDDQPCLIYDLYGRGWSDSPDVPMNIDIFVSQLAELLYALNLPHEKYNLIGVSMGGAIIQRFTELHPFRVSKLILCCSAGLGLNKPSKTRLFMVSLPIIGPLVFKYFMQHHDDDKERLQWAFPDEGKYEKYVKLFRLGWQQHPGYLRALHSTLIHFDFESSLTSIEFIAKLSIPVLIIWGDKDYLIPVSNAYHYSQLYKNSSLTIVPGATHMLLIEHGEHVTKAIKTFLEQHSHN